MNQAVLHKKPEIGGQVASTAMRHETGPNWLFRWFVQTQGAALLLNLMPTPSRRDHPRATHRRSQRGCRGESGSVERWAFNLATESLYALGSSEGVRCVAYRRADGSLRFL